MTRVTVQDRTDGKELPFRITHRKWRGSKAPSIRIKCGCCTEVVVIHLFTDHIEIGNVYGSIDQWRKVLLPILGVPMTE